MTFPDNHLMKNDPMILNIPASNNRKRRSISATAVGSDNYLNLEPRFQLEGLTYRIVPIRNDQRTDIVPGRVNKGHHVQQRDEQVRVRQHERRARVPRREQPARDHQLPHQLSRLTEELMNAGRRDSAIKVLDKCVEVMPDKTGSIQLLHDQSCRTVYYRAAGIWE